MAREEKANELFNKMYEVDDIMGNYPMCKDTAKKCAIIAAKNEYHALRELLFNLKSCRIIENENVYLYRLDKLILEEKLLIEELELL